MRVHFVGIGGVGMSGIAKILLEMGYTVSGSDLVRNDKVVDLEKIGAKINIGHRAINLGQVDVVVTSSAVPTDNVEVEEARRRGIPVICRAQMLGRLMASRRGVAVSGTHGKTTTTSMISLILARAGLDPTIVIGGELGDLGSNAMLGRGDLMVAEADESDGSFLHLSPHTAVITNIETDHMDYYRDLGHILREFRRFIERLPADGTAVICTDCPNAKSLAEEIPRKVITYGLTGSPNVQARNIVMEGLGSTFDVFVGGYFSGSIQLVVPGQHNIVNALGATAVALHYDIPFETVKASLREFHGAERRFQILGEKNGVLVVDDYAHHPTEIRTTLAAARGINRRVVVVFQPHRYTRTKHLFDQFITAFSDADIVVLTDIYPAFESPIPGVSSRTLAARMAEVHPSAFYVGSKEAALKTLQHLCRVGDLLLVMGAGDIREVGERFLVDDSISDIVGAVASGR